MFQNVSGGFCRQFLAVLFIASCLVVLLHQLQEYVLEFHTPQQTVEHRQVGWSFKNEVILERLDINGQASSNIEMTTAEIQRQCAAGRVHISVKRNPSNRQLEKVRAQCWHHTEPTIMTGELKLPPPSIGELKRVVLYTVNDDGPVWHIFYPKVGSEYHFLSGVIWLLKYVAVLIGLCWLISIWVDRPRATT